MSIGKRLSLLVLSELFTAAIVAIAGLAALARLSAQNRYMNEYVFAPLIDIDDATVALDDLAQIAQQAATAAQAVKDARRLRSFIERYQREWEVVGSSQPDAIRFRAMLGRAGRLPLLGEEREAVESFLVSLKRLERDAEPDGDERAPSQLLPSGAEAGLRAALVQLTRVNLRYMQIGYDDFTSTIHDITLLFVALGLAGIVAAPLLGLAVSRAIVPRVRLLVEKVERFRTLGVDEPIGAWEGDELAVLARALDVSFAAIVARDQERERFFAVAAHELKTPLTTLKGYAQAALAHRPDQALRDRALTVIDRQASRLARLVEDLLWSACARGGQLSFHPAPLDLAGCARRVIAEATPLAEGRSFLLTVRGDAHILGDACLVEQSLSSVVFQAMAMSPPRTPVPVTLDADATSVCVTVEARDVETPPGDLDRLMEPFALLQFEGRPRDAIRTTGLGLHLAREIARLHAGALRIERRAGDGALLFVLEFRR
jgi:signal transduction histidine kinase